MNIKKKKTISKNQNGYIALVSVLIFSALLVLIATSFNLISIGETNISLKEKQSWESFYLASACAEEGLMKLQEDIQYNGDETLIFQNGTCTILPGTGSGDQNRIIKASGSVNGFVRRIEVVVSQLIPEIEISSWSEISEF